MLSRAIKLHFFPVATYLQEIMLDFLGEGSTAQAVLPTAGLHGWQERHLPRGVQDRFKAGTTD